jgi:chromosome segregation ATPase
MSTGADSDDRPDIDLTDELPILVDTVVLDSEDRVTMVVSDDESGEHTARFLALAAHEAESIEALKIDLERRAAKIEELERDIERLSERWLEIERHLGEKDAKVGDLSRALAAARNEIAQRTAAEERLAAEIVDRDNKFARVLDQLELLRTDAAGARAELEQLRRERENERAELERQSAAGASPSEQSLREELDALASYVTNRQAWWDEIESRAAAQALRIAELEREVAQRAARQTQTESLAKRETERAEGLRAELVTRARRAETLEAELQRLRLDPAVATSALDKVANELAAARVELSDALRERDRALETVAELHQAQRDRDERHEKEVAMAEQHRAAVEQAAQKAAAQLAAAPESHADTVASTAEVAAQLEAELEHKRLELTSERAAGQERQERLAALTADLETSRRQLAEARAHLEQTRADSARLERTLIDKDRALEARDERIRTLQSELDRKLGALQKLNAMDVSVQGLDSKMSERLRRTEPVEPANTPALICLTSDSPRQYALAKRTMMIGRSSQCDIQILTHFVSREHARVTVSARNDVVIEDLGSTNGVFVNSVRIERQELHHGDLVTVGETQFRFLETMAH